MNHEETRRARKNTKTKKLGHGSHGWTRNKIDMFKNALVVVRMGSSNCNKVFIYYTNMSTQCYSMQISTHSKSTTKRIFDKYASGEDDYGFTKTHVPVSLLKHGQDKLIARSQAKRLLARFDRFNEVSLDFRGVKTVGRAFADEIFLLVLIKK